MAGLREVSQQWIVGSHLFVVLVFLLCRLQSKARLNLAAHRPSAFSAWPRLPASLHQHLLLTTRYCLGTLGVPVYSHRRRSSGDRVARAYWAWLPRPKSPLLCQPSIGTYIVVARTSSSMSSKITSGASSGLMPSSSGVGSSKSFSS